MSVTAVGSHYSGGVGDGDLWPGDDISDSDTSRSDF